MSRRILIVTGVDSKNEIMSYINGIKHFSKHEIFQVGYSDLVLSIHDKKIMVFDPKNQKQINDYSLVHLWGWLDFEEENTALSASLEALQVKNLSALPCKPNFEDKLTQNIKLASAGLSVPDIIYSNKIENYLDIVEDRQLHYPFILKDIQGRMGRNNYLVRDQKELSALIKKHQGLKFLVQNFIENDYDLRIIVLNNKVTSVAKRTRNPKGKDHRNNTSLGGEKQYFEISEVNEQILRDCESFTKKIGRKICSFDVVIEKGTENYYFLEYSNKFGVLYDRKLSRELPAISSLYNTLIE